MQKLQTALLVLFLIGSNSPINGQNSDNDLSKDNLFGNVESVHTVYYESNSRSGKIKKGKKKSEISIFYNEKGNKSKEEFYDKKGRLEKKRIYKYNLLNNNVEISTFNKAGRLTLKIDEKINENGDLIERSTFKEGKLIRKGRYTYTSIGREVRFDSYGADGIMTEMHIFKPNSNGNMIEQNNPNSKERFNLKFKFKEEENLIEGIHWNVDTNINLISYSLSKNSGKENTVNYGYYSTVGGLNHEIHIHTAWTSGYKSVWENNWTEGTLSRIVKTKSGKKRTEEMVINRTIEYYSK